MFHLYLRDRATMLMSSLCRQDLFEGPSLRDWPERLGERFHLYRKLWEWCFIAQALDERGMIREGRRGLGFGVGQEPLAAYFAAGGAEIVATDLDLGRARDAGWTDTKEHADSLADLNSRGLCPADLFRRRVSFRVADMNSIPDDLRRGAFDFTWSSCCFEHLGSIEAGLRFIESQMACLAPGGVAVHTTEFNLSSETETLAEGPTVLFRRGDIEELANRLRLAGHRIELDLRPGTGPADVHIDEPPYSFNPQLRLRLAQYVTTSVGLIIEKGGGNPIS